MTAHASPTPRDRSLLLLGDALSRMSDAHLQLVTAVALSLEDGDRIVYVNLSAEARSGQSTSCLVLAPPLGNA